MRFLIMMLLVAGSAAAAENKGQAALKAFNYCLEEATKGCATNSIRCNSYRHSFVKTCMLQMGIEPEYIQLMIDG